MGYDINFITGNPVPLPNLGQAAKAASFDNGKVIDHTYFSLVFNAERGFAVYTAHNIDGATLDHDIPRDDDFRFDPLVDEAIQIDNEQGYKGSDNPWDRGHLVRRASLHWGNFNDAKTADNESFAWTNIAPQHNTLHQNAWGKIEKWMVDLADESDKRVCVFTGPVFHPDDPEIVNMPGEEPIQIPAGFWKIMVIVQDQELKAAGFLVWQRDYDKAKPVQFDPHLEQVRITTLEHLVGVSFGQLRDLDPLRFTAPAPPRVRAVAAPSESQPALRNGGIVADRTDIVL